MLESAVEAVFARRVRELGGLSYKFAPTHKGNPDRVVLLAGEVYFVEIKADGGRLDPAQVLWHRRARERGVTVLVVTGSAEARAWTPPPKLLQKVLGLG
jgi:hypothetical protein